MNYQTRKRRGLPAAIVLFISWLIPGFGFWYHGLRRRAIFFFVTLEATFLVGAAFRGLVLMPDFNPRHSDSFNLVTILTFITQMFNGLLGFVSLLPDLCQGKFAIFPYQETHYWTDLGSFYLLVSGGMSYFVLVSTYDHFYGHKMPEAGQRQMAGKQR